MASGARIRELIFALARTGRCQPARHSAHNEAQLPQAKKLSVLLADDNALFQEGMKHILYGLGDSVEDVEAASYSEAFKCICEEAKFDKALVDLTVPKLDGFGSLKALRDGVGDAPMVIAFAMEGCNELHRALDCGESGYVPKALYSKVMLSRSTSCSRAGSI